MAIKPKYKQFFYQILIKDQHHFTYTTKTLNLLFSFYLFLFIIFYKGTLLNRLTGHTSSPDFSVRLDGPYVFSYESLVEEDCFKLWDKNTFKCVASYTLDTTVSFTYLILYHLILVLCQLIKSIKRIPTSSGNHAKPGKFQKKFHAWKNPET